MKKGISLAEQFIGLNTGTAVVISAIALCIAYVFTYKQQHDQLNKRMEHVVYLLSKRCEYAMLENSREKLRTKLLISSYFPEIQRVAVEDVYGSVIVKYDKSDQWMETSRGNKNVHSKLKRPIRSIRDTIGYVDITFSEENMISQQRTHYSTYAGILLAMVIVSFLFSMFLHPLISRPIRAIIHMAEKISETGDCSARIQLTGNTEIQYLQSKFNTIVTKYGGMITSLKNEVDYRINSQNEKDELREKLNNIVNAISDPILAIDKRGNVVLANESARNVSGTLRRGVHCLPLLAIFPWLKGHSDQIDRCLIENNGGRFTAHWRYNFIGDDRCFDVTLYPYSKRVASGMVLVFHETTNQLHFEQLMIQNEKMLSFTRLTAGIAHEINDPLGIISAGIQNILRNVVPEKQRNKECANEIGVNLRDVHCYLQKRKVLHYLNGMLDASQRAGEVVIRMLQLSHLEAVEKLPVCIDEVLDQAIELAQKEYELSKKYDFRNITIRKVYDRELPKVMCYVSEIQQVFLNVLKNAANALHRKKSETFNPRILLRLQQDEQYVRIEVSDNGIGISEKILAKVFEPFFTTSEIGDGAGLGLAVSYYIIVKHHEGMINCYSQEGGGVNIVIKLPINDIHMPMQQIA